MFAEAVRTHEGRRAEHAIRKIRNPPLLIRLSAAQAGEARAFNARYIGPGPTDAVRDSVGARECRPMQARGERGRERWRLTTSPSWRSAPILTWCDDAGHRRAVASAGSSAER